MTGVHFRQLLNARARFHSLTSHFLPTDGCDPASCSDNEVLSLSASLPSDVTFIRISLSLCLERLPLP